MRSLAIATAIISLGWISLAAAQTTTPEAQASLERGCEAGNAESCREAARSWITVDKARAIALLERGCAGGDTRSCGGLGLMLVSGDEAGRDYARAAPLLEQACGADFGPACGALANLVYLGVGVPEDPQRARSLMQRGCELRDAQTCAAFGLVASTGEAASLDLGRAATALTFACAEEVPRACEFLENAAASVARGEDSHAPREHSLAIFEAACQGGQPRSCDVLGGFLFEGLLGPVDFERGATAFQRGCALDNARACAALAEAYRRGRGVARDAALARASAEHALAIDPNNSEAARTLRRLR
ncbi:MAG: tetratricopeptide repeat protein [Vitreimonas sp.]